MRKQRRIQTSKEQRETLKLLRKRAGEIGYVPVKVARWYRKHYLDYVLVPKVMRQKFLYVHARRDGSVCVRPYTTPSLYTVFTNMLDALKPSASCPLRWNKQQLPKANDKTYWSHGFIEPSDRRKYHRVFKGWHADEAPT